MRYLFLIPLLIFCLATTLCAQTIRRVAATLPEGSDNSGDTWANATSLEDALSKSTSGDEVWMRDGRYTPPSPSWDPRGGFFSVPAGVALYGGFAGTEPSLSDRNLSTAGTTLVTGERGDPNDGNDNIRRLITVVAGAEVVLDGLTLADASGTSAIFVLEAAVLRIRNCLFRNNTGLTGGAVHGAMRSVLYITGSTFTGNVATQQGGAVHGSIASTLTITSSIFTGNSAWRGGAVFGFPGAGMTLSHASTLIITGSTFIGNSIIGGSFPVGGAVFGDLGTLANNIFFGNTALRGGNQVASDISATGAQSSLHLTNNLMEGSSADLFRIPAANVENPITASSLEAIFVSTTPGSSGYLRLKTGSPAIDAGTNDWIDGDADVYEAGDETDVTDLAGNARLVGSQMDLGAYEYDATLPLLDVTTTPAVTTELPASAGTITAAIDISGGATGWTATTNAPFITLSRANGTTDGTLAISYTANNGSGGGTRTGTVTITTTSGIGVDVIETLTLVQQEGEGEGEEEVLGVIPFGISSITFANPVGAVLQVQGISKPTVLTIHSISGMKQLRTVLSSESNEVDIRALRLGLYLLTFEAAGEKQTRRLLKR